MGRGSGIGRSVVAFVGGIVLLLAGVSLLVSAIGSEALLLRTVAGMVVAAAGAVLIGTNLRRGLVGDRSETCPGCMDPVVPGAERCPNCGHVFRR